MSVIFLVVLNCATLLDLCQSSAPVVYEGALLVLVMINQAK